MKLEHGIAIFRECYYKGPRTNEETSWDYRSGCFLQRAGGLHYFYAKLGARVLDSFLPGSFADAGSSVCECGGVRSAGESALRADLQPFSSWASSRHGTGLTLLF